MRFEWDEAKRRINLKKHGFDFVDAPAIFEQEHVIVLDERFDYEEPRFMAFGLLRGEVIVVVFVDRPNDAIQFISVRKASSLEAVNFINQIRN